MSSDDQYDRFAYLAEGNARQARKRVAADALIRDDAGRVLLVDPTYKDHWDLPGGRAEANESPRAAVERELREELGLSVSLGRLLVLDWDEAHGPWDDQLVFVFDCGRLDDNQLSTIRIVDPELANFTFAELGETAHRLRQDMVDRLARALAAAELRTTDYREGTHSRKRALHDATSPKSAEPAPRSPVRNSAARSVCSPLTAMAKRGSRVPRSP